jgi:uroporphyrin-III C-methyltransferase
MLHHASQNQSVLRLKSGDPLIFGRAGEEISFLTEQNLPFEIVPGITAASAVAAELRVPLTDRSSSSKLILATAHHAAGKVELAPTWSGPLPSDATLAIYMPGRDFETLAQNLIASGLSPSTCCTAVSKASTREQEVTHATLSTLSSQEIGPAPVILLIGPTTRC